MRVLSSAAGLLAVLAFSVVQAQTNTPGNKTKTPAALNVDKVVAHPAKFKGTIRVEGRVSKVDSKKNLFLLGCEDACVAMPVKFAGTAPKEGSDVTVRGQITKDAKGRYVFDAEDVTPKK